MSIEELDRREVVYTLLDCLNEYRHFVRLLDNWEGVDIGEVRSFMVRQYVDGRKKSIREFNSGVKSRMFNILSYEWKG